MKIAKTFALVLALGPSVIAAPASADVTQWTLAYLPVKGTIYEEVALAIPDRIAKATAGRLVIKPNPSLVAGNRLLEGVRDGLVQVSLPLIGYYSGAQPLFTVPSLPGISESYEDLVALNRSAYGDQIRAILDKNYNAAVLMETAFCPQTLFSTVPIRTVEEWKGRKLRVNNRGTGLVAGALGATPVSLSAAEVLPALERGVVEGVVTDTCWAFGAGFQTVVKHAANWRLGSVLPSPVLVNKTAWAALDDGVRQAVKAEFARIEADFARRWKERVAEMPGLWRKAGVQVHDIPDAEMQRVYADVIQKPVLESWRVDMKRVGLDADATLAAARRAVR